MASAPKLDPSPGKTQLAPSVGRLAKLAGEGKVESRLAGSDLARGKATLLSDIVTQCDFPGHGLRAYCEGLGIAAMHFEYHCWYSRRVERDMSLLMIGHAGAKVLIFPTRDGDFREYENLRIHHRLAEKIRRGHLQLYCVDGYARESLYAGWMDPHERIRRHIRFEEYILHEVMPLMAMKNGHECTISHGLSLGAYYAANIAFRHPHLFRKLCAFSGRYDLTLQVESFGNLFGGHYNEDIYFHNPSHFLPNLSDHHVIGSMRRMDIVMVVGRDDPFVGDNHHVSRTLWGKGISHGLHEWEGRAHEGYSWRRMAPIYL